MLRRTTYAVDCRLGTHAHDDHRIVLAVDADWQSAYGRRPFALGAARGMFRPAGVEHRDAYSRESVCISIGWRGGDAPGSPIAFTDPELPHLVDALDAELMAADASATLVLESIAAELAGRARRARTREGRRPRWVARVREWLEEHSADPPSLSDIAAAVDRDVSHVATTFRAAHGTSIGEYVRNVRVWRARSLIDDATIPLATVAHAAGFADQSHFTRLFRQRFGMSPGAYRLCTREPGRAAAG